MLGLGFGVVSRVKSAQEEGYRCGVRDVGAEGRDAFERAHRL